MDDLYYTSSRKLFFNFGNTHLDTNHKSQIKTTTQKTSTHNIEKILYLSLDKSWTKYLNL